MTEEEKKAFVDSIMGGVKELVAPIATSVAELKAAGVSANSHTMAMVEPHAKGMEACADGMQAAGIGGHPTQGHSVILRKMAGDLRAAGAQGRIPDSFGGSMYNQSEVTLEAIDVTKTPEYVALKASAEAQKTELETLANTVKEIKAQARTLSDPPARKTVDAADLQRVRTVMIRAGVEEPGDGKKVSLQQLNAGMEKAGMTTQERLKTKITLERAGLLEVAA